ncbi:MAG: DUF4139 domain-containing protein [Nitrospiraceae bacterium]|nr:DUF4139 domain-containing protein [Nitrospiraceae bacterium]
MRGDDILSGLEHGNGGTGELQIATKYRIEGKLTEYFPMTLDEVERAEPVYETLPGWTEDISSVRDYDALLNEQDVLYGADDLVRVKYSVAEEKRGETGLISTSRTDSRNYKISVKNMHERAIGFTALDRIPVSRNDQIKVELEQHPTVQKVLEIFGGRIRAIRSEGDDQEVSS